MAIRVKDLTISIKLATKKTNIRHNNRDLTEKEYQDPAHSHIIREKTKHNIIMRQQDIKEAYKELFAEELEKYNEKQKRQDRKIKDYYRHVQHSKTLNVQKEMIVGLGAKEDWDKMSFEEKKEAGYIIAEYIQQMAKANRKNMYIYNAVIHLDENGAPHAHVNFVPLAHGYKKGMKTQPSFSKALNQLGYKGKGRGPYIEFREAEVARMEKIINERGISRKLGETNKDPNLKAYQERKDLEREIKEQKEELSEIADKIADQTLELEEAKEKQAQELAQQKQELEAQKNELKRQVEENIAKINEQKKEIQQNNNEIARYNEETHFVTKRDRALARLEHGLRKMDEPIDYEKEVGTSKIFPGKVVMSEKTYKKMREKASFFSTFGDLRDALVSAIKESPIVKKLQEQVAYWKNKFFNLEKSYNKMKEDLEEDIVNLEGDINWLNKELEQHRLFEHQFKKYLSEGEQERIFETIRTREAKDIEENGLKKARARDDDFSYDR